MQRIYLLDFIRVITVVLVLIFHLNIHLNLTTSITLIDNFISQGATSMTLFFMLSGFLYYYCYSDKLKFEYNTIKEFYKSRFIKIYVLYFLCMSIYMIIYAPNFKIFLRMLPMQIIPLQAFFPSTFNTLLNGGLWFVSDILFLYLCFPIFLYILKFTKINLYILFAFVYLLINYSVIIDLYYPSVPAFLYVSPFFRCLEFFAGMIAAKISNQINIKYFSSFKIIICICFYILIVGLLKDKAYLHNVRFYSSYLNFDLFLVPLFGILLFICSKTTGGFLLKISKSRVCLYLSKISYAFYLSQIFVLLPLKNSGLKFDNNFQLFCTALITNTILSIILFEITKYLFQLLKLHKRKIL